jgi:proton-dependent oligopeptide transporter, POT family
MFVMDNKFKQSDKEFFGHPKPLKGLFYVELWERFSYYGILPLLILYMAAITTSGGMGLDRPTSSAILGIFSGSLYLITIFGGWIADRCLGQARSIWYGSVIIALGHLSIALDAILGHFFFYIGLVFIVLGSGLFKTCISTIVGTLYSQKDSRRDAGFSIFYMGINIGGLISPLVTGLLAENYGWHIGFGAGGIGMLFALLIFRFVSIPQLKYFNALRESENNWNRAVNYNPNASKYIYIFLICLTTIITLITFKIIPFNPVIVLSYLAIMTFSILILYFVYLIFIAKTTSQEKKQLVVCFILIVAAAIFWSASDQTYTSITLFTEDFTNRSVLGFMIPTAWFQAINPIFIIIFSPILAFIWVKLGRKNQDLSYISKFGLALFLGSISFIILYFASHQLVQANGMAISPLWIIAFYLFLTIGELCFSPIGLSCMTVLAPQKIQGQIMGLWFISSALGGMIAGLVGGEVSAENINELPSMFKQCAVILIVSAAILFILNKPISKLIHSSSKPTE